MNQGGIWQNGGSGLNRCCKKMTPKSGSVFRRWVGQNMTGVNRYVIGLSNGMAFSTHFHNSRSAPAHKHTIHLQKALDGHCMLAIKILGGVLTADFYRTKLVHSKLYRRGCSEKSENLVDRGDNALGHSSGYLYGQADVQTYGSRNRGTGSVGGECWRQRFVYCKDPL